MSDITGGNARKSSKDRGSSTGSSSSRFVNRHGHYSRSGHVPAAIETGNGRCHRTVAHRNERDCQWQNRHVEQRQLSTAEKWQKNQLFPSHTESAISFHETGKAVMTDTSCRTCTCGCKCDQTKEKRRLSALRATLVSVESTDKFDSSTLVTFFLREAVC